MKHLHPDDEKLFLAVKNFLLTYASRFNLALTEVSPMPRRKTHTRYGDCSQDGRVRITLRDFHKGQWSKEREIPYVIVEVMAHELAHLRHYNHRDYWMILFAEIMREMAASGVLDKIRKLCKNK